MTLLKRKTVLVLAAALGLSVVSAAASAASPAQPTPIQHIVVLYMENHSFDNLLGYWCDDNPGRCPDGGMPASVALSDGSVVTPGVTPDIVPDIAHTVVAQTAALDGGRMDGWQNVIGCDASTGYACISGYEPDAVPNLTALASTYAISDAAFTEADSPSWGGHLNELAGTTDGFTGNNPHKAVASAASGPGWGCDAFNKVAAMLPVNGRRVAAQPACVPDFRLGPDGGAWEPTVAQHVPTIMDLMDAAGVSWRIYAQPTAGAGSHKDAYSGGYIWSGCPSFADCLDTSQDANLVESNQFFTDAAAGSLPSVSFVMPAGDGNDAFSMHNTQSNAAGDNWIGKVAAAALTGPQASSTVLVVTWDDCGCFFDQVPPPIAPDGRQMGPRVPFIVAGAYVKPGFTDQTVTSSTGSILAFIEWVFGLPSLGQNDDSSYKLSGMFDFTEAPTRFPHMTWRRLPAWKYKATAATAHDGT